MPRWAGTAVVALAISATSCLTADRLWRVTPFEGASSSERVNLWPLAYHDGDQTAVLWPLFDVDSHGFALRPLVAKDDAAFSVLFPFAAWDTDAGAGWAVPFYWSEARAGLFPLANVGAPFSWIGPVWWSEHSGGLFPLAMFGSFNYVGPAWWTSDELGGMGGLFPVAMFGSTSYVGPFWWSHGGSYGVFPLFGRNLFGSDIGHVGPVWWRSGGDEREGSDVGLFPLVSWGDGGKRFSLFPLYSHELDGDTRTRNVLLGVGHSATSAAEDERWLLPLYYHKSEPEKSDTVFVPFFWKRTRGERADVYTLLGNRAVDPASTSLNLYPLWWSDEHGDSAWRMLLPLFYFEREGDARTLLTPLGGRGWSSTGQSSFVNVLGPLYHHSEDASRAESRTAFLWPLYDHVRRGDERTTRLLGLYTRTVTPTSAETTYALGLGHVEHTATGSSHRLWPLYSWSDDVELPGPFYRFTLYRQREREGGSSLSLFPLFSSASYANGSEWSALLGLVHHESEGSADGSHARSWAWPLVSRSSGARPGLADRTALFGSARWDGGSQFQLGASLLHSSTREEDARSAGAHARTLLLFTHDEERFVGAHVPAPEPASARNRVRQVARGFLFDAFVSERETYHVWRAGVLGADEAQTLRTYSLERGEEGLPDRDATRAVLAAHGAAPSADSPAAIRAAIDTFAAANTRSYERRHLRVPLVCGYERSDQDLEWSGPLGLVHYERDPERSRFSLFYYGYRSETQAGRTSRDIFPFVTWDTGPSETRVSFLWHLLDYEHQGDRRGGHVLFVPWGDA